jgi:outer membrane protein OmpA-like peptidoglycan-associated protein
MSVKLKRFLRFFKLGIIAFTVVILAGCASVKGIYSDKCKALMLRYELAHQLDKAGIRVIALGDNVTLILPTDKYFYSGSNNLFSTNHLNTVVKFLNAYPTEDIQVKGYVHTGCNMTRNLALSRDRAQKIADYLVYHGLDTRLISASGYGCQDIYDFDHIEIYFRQPPPDNVFH